MKFKKGYCKWKAVNSEYNHIAYWSCYKSQIQVKDEITGNISYIKLKAMINWGQEWKVTHLGPIPKQ